MKLRVLLLLSILALALAATAAHAKKYSVADDLKKAAEAKQKALAELAKPYQAQVEVDASKAIATIHQEMFGQNVNVYEGSGDGTDTVYNAAVTAMGTNLMRFPGGAYAEFTDWENYRSGKVSWLPIDLDKGIAFAKATNCQLQIIVNCVGNWGDQKHTVDEAVDKARRWVRYMNVKPGALHCDYWEVGNENFDMKGVEYAERFVKFYKAMKAEDPTIKIGLQIQYDHAPWTVDILKTLQKTDVRPDFFIVHSYPIWFPAPGRKAGDAPDWDKKLYAANPYQDTRILDLAVSFPTDFQKQLDKLVADNLDPQLVGKIPYWMTEYRSVLEYKFDEFVDAMFCPQFFLTMAQNHWLGANIWALKNGFSKETGCDFGLLRTGVNADFPDDNPKNMPRPTYYMYPFLSKVFGHEMVQCSYPDYAPLDTEGNKVRAWASKDQEGNLTLFLVNNHPTAPAKISVKVAGFASGTEGKTWLMEPVGRTLEGESEPVLQRRDITLNGVPHPDPASLPGEGKPLSVGNTFEVTLPGPSMMYVKIPKGSGAVLDASALSGKPQAAAGNQPAAASVAAAKPKAASGEMVLQDFLSDEKGVFSPWKDDKGSSLSYTLSDVKPGGKPGEKMINIKFNQVGGGWCGLFCRAGSDWNGVDASKAKTLVIRVFSAQSVGFGISLADDAKHEAKLQVNTDESDKWQTIKLPVEFPEGFKGTVNGLNLFMSSGGEGTFSISKITLLDK